MLKYIKKHQSVLIIKDRYRVIIQVKFTVQLRSLCFIGLIMSVCGGAFDVSYPGVNIRCVCVCVCVFLCVCVCVCVRREIRLPSNEQVVLM